jgi:hypothetical protein
MSTMDDFDFEEFEREATERELDGQRLKKMV